MPHFLVTAVILGVALYGTYGTLVRLVCFVPQHEAFVVERLGRFSRILRGGIHLLIPWVDRVRAKVDLREQVLSVTENPVIARDHLVTYIDVAVDYTVIDPKAATYEVVDLRKDMQRFIVLYLREVLATIDREVAVSRRHQIANQLRSRLYRVTEPWGIRINQFELSMPGLDGQSVQGM